MNARVSVIGLFACLAVASGLVRAGDLPGASGEAAGGGRGISVSLEKADLRAVVTALARAHQINLVGTGKLSGEVTLHLSEAPVLEALEVILKNAGFVMVRRESGIYEVLSAKEQAKAQKPDEPAKVVVFSLVYADVEETADLLVPAILPDASQVKEDVESRRLIVTGTDRQLSRVAEVLKAFDKPVRLVRVFELRYKEAEAAAKLLVPGAVPEEASIAKDPLSNRLIIVGTQDQLRKVEQILAEVDRPLPQVSITAKIVEIKVDRARSLGISITEFFKSSKFGDAGSGELGIDLTQSPVSATTVNASFVSDRIDAAVKALVEKDVAEILSEPTVATGHKQKAEMNVVNQVPVITRHTRVVDQVTLTDEEVTFKETGVKLQVTPRVLADGQIEMDIQPAVLELTGWTDTDPAAPIIDTREAKTVVTIADGKWVVIGGLMRYNERKLRRGVPVLMDAPLIGGLFSTTLKTREKSNLVILVSATLLDDVEAAAQRKEFEERLWQHRQEHEFHSGEAEEQGDEPAAEAEESG
ncbi:MAG: secretin N-terminal domain-containing protein [Planctomycetota bacterium]